MDNEFKDKVAFVTEAAGGMGLAAAKAFAEAGAIVVLADINDIDDAYREKYNGSPYLSAMISERARVATIRISAAG